MKTSETAACGLSPRYSRLDVLRYLGVVKKFDRGLWQRRRIRLHDGDNGDPIQLPHEIAELQLRVCDRSSIGA